MSRLLLNQSLPRLKLALRISSTNIRPEQWPNHKFWLGTQKKAAKEAADKEAESIKTSPEVIEIDAAAEAAKEKA